MLLDKLYVAERLHMTLWPCTCVDDMHPLERRLWSVYFRWASTARRREDEIRAINRETRESLDRQMARLGAFNGT